jgi:hypothetical protein
MGIFGGIHNMPFNIFNTKNSFDIIQWIVCYISQSITCNAIKSIVTMLFKELLWCY